MRAQSLDVTARVQGFQGVRLQGSCTGDEMRQNSNPNLGCSGFDTPAARFRVSALTLGQSTRGMWFRGLG